MKHPGEKRNWQRGGGGFRTGKKSQIFREKRYISKIRLLKGHANSHKTTIHASTYRTSKFFSLG